MIVVGLARRAVVVGAAAFALAGTSDVAMAAGAGEGRPGLAVVGDGTNVWVVVERVGEQGIERTLLHHASDMDGPFVREVIRFDEVPLAMAAGQGRLWLVMAPHDASRPRREVYSVKVERHPMTGVHMYLPTSRLELLPSLPGEGEFLGACVLGDAPLCLLGDSAPWTLGASEWHPLPEAPAGLALWPWGPQVAVVTCQSPFEAVVLDPRGARTALSGVMPGSAPWTGVSGVATPHVLAGREVWTWQADGPVKLTDVPEGEARWGIVGYAGQVLCVQADSAGEITARAYDDATHMWSPAIAWTLEPSQAGVWVWLVVGTVALATLAGVGLGMAMQRTRLSLKGESKDGR